MFFAKVTGAPDNPPAYLHGYHDSQFRMRAADVQIPYSIVL